MNDLFEEKRSTYSHILAHASDVDEIVCVFTGSKSHVIRMKRNSTLCCISTSASKLIGLEASKQIGERKLFCRYVK